VVYFKNSGGPVIAKALVSKVLQFIFSNEEEVRDVIERYGKKIGIINSDPKTWPRMPKYCILVFLTQPTSIKKPFQINKAGFGSAAAWLFIKSIATVKIP
jgi:hypothetical protein